MNLTTKEKESFIEGNQEKEQKGLQTKGSMRRIKPTFYEERRVPTLPILTKPKIYKRKVGDPTRKICSDEGIYGDEKDDYSAHGPCSSEKDIDLFDIVCEKCQGDHLVMFCPYKKEGKPIPKQEMSGFQRRQYPSGNRGDCPTSTICWNCHGPHYYRDCPEKEWHGQLEKAKEESDDFHLNLLVNSKGYARLNQLTQKQIEAIRKSQSIPLPHTSTRAPYKEVSPPTTKTKAPKPVPKHYVDQEYIQNQNKMRYNRELASHESYDTKQWIEEQNTLDNAMKHVHSRPDSVRTMSPEYSELERQTPQLNRKGNVQRKQKEPRKIIRPEQQTFLSRPVPVQSIASQVREESLEKLQQEVGANTECHAKNLQTRMVEEEESRSPLQETLRPELKLTLRDRHDPNKTIYIKSLEEEIIYEGEPASNIPRVSNAYYENVANQQREIRMKKVHSPFIPKIRRSMVEEDFQSQLKHVPNRKDWEEILKKTVGPEGELRKKRAKGVRETDKGRNPNQQKKSSDKPPPTATY